MTIMLRPISVENWSDCVDLSPTEEQVEAGFVAPNVTQASFESWWQPTGIYADEVMVGFVMYGTWPATGLPPYIPAGEVPAGEDYILRFMIDGRYQRKGYGRVALALLIDRLRQRPGVYKVALSYEPWNAAASALYASMGFQLTGEKHGEEVVAALDFQR